MSVTKDFKRVEDVTAASRLQTVMDQELVCPVHGESWRYTVEKNPIYNFARVEACCFPFIDSIFGDCEPL